MATGDKLYLADKPTLDEVKSGVETIQTHVDVTRQQVIDSKAVIDASKSILDAVRSDVSQARTDIANVKSLTSSIQTNTNNSYITVDKLSKTRYGVVSNSVSTSNRELLNVQGSGLLHFAYTTVSYNTTTQNTVYLSIIVDGVTIYGGSLSPTSNLVNRIGYSSITSIIGLDNNSYAKLANGDQLNTNLNTAPAHSHTGPQVIFTDRPIKFNTSLMIRGYAVSSSGTLYYHYELD